jgi:hypothetical protein
MTVVLARAALREQGAVRADARTTPDKKTISLRLPLLLMNGEEFVAFIIKSLKPCNDEQSDSTYFLKNRNPSFLKFLKLQNLKRLNSLRLRTDTGVTYC